MRNLYKNGDRYYRMIEPVGTWKRKGCEHYALWKPIRRFLWFWIRRSDNFWLDMAGFVKQ